MSIDFSAAVIAAIRYISLMLSLPPAGELMNICIFSSPAEASAGK